MKIVQILKSIRQNEPVRLYVYLATVAVAGVLVAKGLITNELSDHLIAIIADVVLGIGAAETARAKVTPAGKVADAVQDVVYEVSQAGVSPEVQEILDRARKTVTDAIGRHRRA